MAIVKMQKLGICANKRKRKAILETLQKLGTVEIFTDEIEDEDLSRMDTQEARVRFERNADSFDRALKLLNAYAPVKTKGLSLFAGKEPVNRSDYERVVSNIADYLDEVSLILKDDKEISECGGLIARDQNQIESLTPWLGLGIPMNTEGTKNTTAFIGTLPEPCTEERLYEAASKELPSPVCLTAEVISAGSDLTCVSVLCLKRDSGKVEENLRAIGFARPSQPTFLSPAETKAELEADIAAQQKRIEELKSEIASFGGRREEYRIVADYFRTRAEKYRILGMLPQSSSAFFLEGWVPADKADRVVTLLTEKYGAYVEREEIREEDDQPTILHNNSFSEAAEGVLESYGLPRHGHVDPTTIMSVFYVFFFGMMLSDAGYGIVMFTVCGIVLLKYPRMAEGTKKMMRLFFWCGISTTFWGVMYGGFFGDALNVIARTFFGYTGDGVFKAMWFEPLKDPMRLLVWCMLFGVIHLYVGLGIKGYEYLKAGDVVGFISDILAWYAFLTGLILMLVPSDLFSSIAGMTFNFPAWAGPLAKGLTIGGMVVILLMSGRGRKNWALRIALGAYDIYGVTGWLSDVLSYSRLLALGLATGVIGNVINMMASMFGGGIVGAILFIVIFVLGHTLNIGINALGAYVHTNRLQYVEFFGKFYEAGGRAFTPFQNANQYVEVKEER